jgi:hypothetical protein
MLFSAEWEATFWTAGVLNQKETCKKDDQRGDLDLLYEANPEETASQKAFLERKGGESPSQW